jgi:hypothetical protein
MYETKTVDFGSDLVKGTVSSAKCDLSNSALYNSYVTNKNVPSLVNVFVDFSFTLRNPAIQGGIIEVVLEGMVTPSGSGT